MIVSSAAPRRTAGALLLLATSILAWVHPVSAVEVETQRVPQFASLETEHCDAGYLTLRWHDNTRFHYQVELANNPSFSGDNEVFPGSEGQVFLSGLRSGEYYVRLRQRPLGDDRESSWSPWSKSKKLLVEHHSLLLTFGLFSAGAAVFVSIVHFVLGHERKRRRLAR